MKQLSLSSKDIIEMNVLTISRAKVMMMYILLMLPSFPAIGQINVEGAESKTLKFTKIFFDETGRNSLELIVRNPCMPDTPPWDADYCDLKVKLEGIKSSIGMSYTHPHPEMSLIYFDSSDVAIEKVKGLSAVLVPFYYCGNSEDYNKTVSYIIFYKRLVYIHHIDFRCDDKGKCMPQNSLATALKHLPDPLRTYFIRYVTGKHRLMNSFPQ